MLTINITSRDAAPTTLTLAPRQWPPEWQAEFAAEARGEQPCPECGIYCECYPDPCYGRKLATVSSLAQG